MTLKDLLYTICNDGEERYGTILNTDHESFPKEFRHRSIYYAELYIDIVQKGAEDELFNRQVKSISLQPRTDILLSELEEKGLTSDNIFEKYPLCFNNYEGFCIEVEDLIPIGITEDDEGHVEVVHYPNKKIYHFAAVIKVVLEDEVC